MVADIDTGINPYHAYYNAGSPIYPAGSAPSSVTPEVLAELGIDEAHQLTLTRTGDFAKDFATDAALWAGIKKGELYWFKGTNIIATTLRETDDGGRPILPDDDDDTHGVGTSASVLAANPEAIILFVEPDALGSEASHAFAFQHASVDIVTTSYGVSVPLAGVPLPEANTFFNTFEGVVTLGKLHFSSSGNGPGLSPLRAGAGPWWSIGISGFEEDSSNGRTTLSGRLPDFVADFTQQLPYCAVCEDGYEEFVAGTSFSTPLSAGIASKLLLDVRRAYGHKGGIEVRAGNLSQMAVAADGRSISNWQLRRALEEAAYIPQLADYDPVEAVFDLGSLPVNPAAPWLQIGWGLLSANPEKGVVAKALAFLGVAGEAPAAKTLGYCEFQTGLVQLRHQYWDNVSPLGALNPVLTGGAVGEYEEDPFIYC